jgi:hypothetical protein
VPASSSTNPEASTTATAETGAERPLLIVNLLHPRAGARGRGFFQAYRDDLRGFVIGWAVVGALVFALWLFLRL